MPNSTYIFLVNLYAIILLLKCSGSKLANSIAVTYVFREKLNKIICNAA